MSKLIRSVAVALALCATPSAGWSQTREPPLPHASFATLGPATSVPYGWIDFCRRYAGECIENSLSPVTITLTQASLKQMLRINAGVNKAVTPVSDSDHWGVLDRWDYPTDGKGDCEDFALLKRKLLMEEGFPRQALLMTVVKDQQNEGHAILTVKTDHGEFILDNLQDEIKPWDKTPYRFVKRQSEEDENVWVQIGEPTPAPAYVSR
ncbi:transglutaminase-like cysteine peptidase [Beijerinckia indica]|uniref:Transglutaminase family protein cysteine peptidase BTLCP n=1 Tax=Beijerinckia indica subsp. indica (strain ATCC 9039 / DSM 1715 / NCIMB 8712) TaxID=395963 RepID=B2IHK1_BEII9|nr:transglutaminase-like cysteine peptidase [Beijerinckia indica]ACB94522.1 transglutaminase family protein cysteine peptidase BTLCP [Beijerinckia indica subsp. indica ATCC 9039]